jgi:hypothetical protein
MFDFWTGELEFTFDFVASMLHRGKVMIQIEPNIAQYALVTASPALNKNYAVVLDLQETQTISVCVKWMQPKFWLRVPKLQLSNRSVGNSFTTPSAFPLYANGFIFVTPFTSLQSPDGSAINVNVYVRGVNLKFNQIDNVGGPNTIAFTEAGVTFSNEVSCKPLGEPVLNSDYASALHFGEQPASFRSYLKRYWVTNNLTNLSPAANAGYTLRPLIFPPIVPSLGAGSGTRPSLYSYLRYAYLALSGNVRKRFAVTGVQFRPMDLVRVTLNEPGDTDSSNVTFVSTAARPGGDLKGTLAFVPATQGGVEVEIPFYSNNFFLPSGLSTISAIKTYGATDTNFDPYFTESYSFYIWPTLSATDVIGVVEETGAAEDFTLMYWISAPFFNTDLY